MPTLATFDGSLHVPFRSQGLAEGLRSLINVRYRARQALQDAFLLSRSGMIQAKLIALVLSVAVLCNTSLALGASACGSGGAAQVMVIPSLHKLLNSNPNYSYTRLYAIVAGFRPDLVGVEIRQEDLARSEEYLRHNYPREMVELFGLYRDRVFGFDWLGDELKGIPVPDDWWKRQSRIKQLERAWDASPPPLDDRMKQLERELGALSDRQTALGQTATPNALASGPYDKVTADYYRTMAMLTRATPYALLPQWYAERDRHLADRIVTEIRQHPGCRIAIVAGADHHGPIIAAIGTLVMKASILPVP